MTIKNNCFNCKNFIEKDADFGQKFCLYHKEYLIDMWRRGPNRQPEDLHSCYNKKRSEI